MFDIFEVRRENARVTSILMRGDAHDSAVFAARKPGQWASIQLVRDGVLSSPHPFTISNQPQDKFIQITIKSVGEFTNKIPEVKPGTQAVVKGPFGTFLRDVESHPSVTMLAGGIGITPFLSVLRHYRNIGAHNRVVLLWGNNGPDDLFGIPDLENLRCSLNLKIVVAFGIEDPPPAPVLPSEWHIEKGFLTKETIAKHFDERATKTYVCGPQPMHAFVIAELSNLGLEANMVETEKFPSRNADPV